MKSMKKLLSCALALTIAAGMFALPAAAEESGEQAAVVESFEVPETDGTVDAEGFDVDAKGVLVAYTGTATDITIPSNVVTIKQKVFAGKNITSVVIPSTVNKIEPSAFLECKKLTSANINAKIIGYSAFEKCTALTTVTLGENVEELQKSGEVKGVFTGCSALKKIVIPSKVKVINHCTFKGCSSLESVTFPAGLTTIGLFAFQGCTSLKSFVLPSALTEIQHGAFTGCSSITSLTIPSSVEKVHNQAFSECTALKELTISYGCNMEKWGNEVFYKCSALEKVSIPSSTTSIPRAAFSWCESLKEVILPTSLKSIDVEAFHRTYALKEIVIPDSVETISNSAFQYSGLVTVKMNPVKLGGHTFQGCDDLATVTIGEKDKTYVTANLESISTAEFDGDKKLNEIYFGNTMKTFFKLFAGDENATELPTYGITNVPADVTVYCIDGVINPKSVKSISVETPPTKKEYEMGEALDVTGGYIRVKYTKGDDKIFPITLGMCSGFDSSTAGQKTVTVTYENKTTTFKVTVKKGSTPTPTPTGDITLNGKPVASYEAAIKEIGDRDTGEYTITIDKPVTVTKFTFPKKATLTITATGTGSILTAATSLAPTAPLTLECPISNIKGKDVSINAKSNLTLTGGVFGNITVSGGANINNVIVNGTVKFAAKADKKGFATDMMTGSTVAKGVTSNNNVIFTDCPSLGTINVKGYVKLTGDYTKCVSLTSSSKYGTTEVQNLAVEKNVTITNSLIADGLSVNGSVNVKNYASLTDTNVAGKISVKGLLSVNGDVICAAAISCAQLTSDEAANLTYVSLAVTKSGIAADSADITVKVIDKNGNPVQCVAGKKTAVVVKSFKLPKGGTYKPVLILHEACGNGTLTFFKNKIVLV